PAQGSHPGRGALSKSRGPSVQRPRPADQARMSRTSRRAPPTSRIPPRGRCAQLSFRRRLRSRHSLRVAVGGSRRSALEPAERAALFLERARGADGLGSGRAHPRGGGGGARSLSRRPPPLFIDSPGGAPFARGPALVLRSLSAPRAPGGYAGLAGGERARVPLARACGALLRPAGAGAALRRALFPPPAWLKARYEGVGSSLVACYWAHCRRLGQVLSGARSGLTPRKRT